MEIFQKTIDVLDPISIIIGIITFIPIVWTWWAVTFGKKRLQAEWVKEIKENPGSRPSVLVVDLKPNADIWPQVLRTIQENEQLKTIGEDRMFKINRAKRLKSESMQDLVDEIRVKLAEIMKAGTDSIHLIYAGPVTPMAVIGAELSNCCRVILYQHDQGTYSNWGPLKYR